MKRLLQILVIIIMTFQNVTAQNNKNYFNNIYKKFTPPKNVIDEYDMESSWSEGMIITTENDTLIGRIKIGSNKLIGLPFYVRYMENPSSKPGKLYNNEIKYFEYEDRIFVPANLSSSCFIELIEKGEVSLYASFCYMPSPPVVVGNEAMYANSSYYSQPGSFEIEYYLERNGKLKGPFSEKKFAKKASKYFKDFPELSEFIIDRELQLNNLINIVRAYNDWHTHQ